MAALEAAATQFGALDRVEPGIPEQLRQFVAEPTSATRPLVSLEWMRPQSSLALLGRPFTTGSTGNVSLAGVSRVWGKMIPLEQIAGKGEVVTGSTAYWR